MKHIENKELEKVPFIISTLLWYISMVAKWTIGTGIVGFILIGIYLYAALLGIPYQVPLVVILVGAAIHTGWVVYKAFKTGKVKLKRKKKGEDDEHL